MKIFCKTCGIHFKQDFEKTLQTPCNFWGQHGVSNLPSEDKQRIWDWLFSMPSDELFVKYQLGMSFDFSFETSISQNVKPFNEIFTNYDSLSEEEQQDLQRKYYRGEIKLVGDNHGQKN